MEALISGSIVLLALGVAFRVTHKRVDTVSAKMDGKQDKTMCEVIEENVKEKFDRGNTKFSQLETKTDQLLEIQHEQTTMLARIDERMAMWAQDNGIK